MNRKSVVVLLYWLPSSLNLRWYRGVSQAQRDPDWGRDLVTGCQQSCRLEKDKRIRKYLQQVCKESICKVLINDRWWVVATDGLNQEMQLNSYCLLRQLRRLRAINWTILWSRSSTILSIHNYFHWSSDLAYLLSLPSSTLSTIRAGHEDV